MQKGVNMEEGGGDEAFVKNPVDAILYSYLLALGEFDFDFGTEGMWMMWLIFLTSTFFLLIVLLNLVIAIMGSAYARLEELSEQSMAQEQIIMIMENNYLINRKKKFKKANYLIIVADDDDEEDQEVIQQLKE